MDSSEHHLEWPLGGSPKVQRADRFLHRDRGFETVYNQRESCALHVYDYSGRMRLGNREFEITPRVLTLTPIGQPSRYDLLQDGYHWCVHFSPLPAEGQTVRLPVRVELAEEHADVSRHLAEIARLHALSFRRGNPGRTAAAAASASLQSLLLRLALFPDADETPAPRTAADAAIEHLLNLINERLDHSLRVPELSAEVGLSQNYLARRFREQFGTTIPRYLLCRRIDVARQLLRGTDLPVKVIAARVGMPDAQHFNKQFRRFAQLSPTDYRSHARLDEQRKR